jgi:hypothetical protein
MAVNGLARDGGVTDSHNNGNISCFYEHCGSLAIRPQGDRFVKRTGKRVGSNSNNGT